MPVNNNNKISSKIRTIFIVFMVVVLVAMGALIGVLFTTLENNLYTERSTHLYEIVDKSSDIINEVFQTSFSYTKILMHTLAEDALPTSRIFNSLRFADELIDAEESAFLAIDTNGNYYSSFGTMGRVSDFQYYSSSSSEDLVYVDNLTISSTQTVEYMIFRSRLSTPLTLLYEDSTSITIAYCATIRNMDYILKKMNQDIDTTTNSFIISVDDGTMLYRQLGYGLLIRGWNFYQKLTNEQVSYLHNDSAAAFEQNIKDKKTQAIEVTINGDSFYMASSNIGDTNFAYSVLVKTADFSGALSSYETDLLFYLVGIILLFAAAVVACVIFAIQVSNHRKMMSKEQEANALLSQAAESAQQASLAKTEFLSHMSHDIRTPINGIMGMTDIALKVNDNPQKTIECLNKIDGASKHLLSLINDVLDMSRIESGRINITNKPFELKSTMDNCASIIRGQIGNRDLNLIVEYNGLEIPHLLGDELHLRQIFINILGNAAKFTPDGGRITFSIKELDKSNDKVTYEFTIADTGIGMSEEFLQTIWDAFSQEEDDSRTQYKGTGLGMAITKQFVDMMNGEISVTSKKGEGSTFIVKMPFDINHDFIDFKQIDVEALNLEGVKVLLVEDNELNIEIAQTLLEANGLIVDIAENGRIAVEKFNEAEVGKYDAILMDIMMPEMNGLEATRAIRALDKEDSKSIPIIAMTANAYDEDIKKTKEAGMNEHISKPIEINMVLSTIAKYLKK